MKNLAALSRTSDAVFSLDHQFSQLSRHSEDLLIVRVLEDGGIHENITGGDLLAVEPCGLCPKCDGRALLLIKDKTGYKMVTKRSVASQLRRASLHAVGGPPKSDITVIGRVVGWMVSS